MRPPVRSGLAALAAALLLVGCTGTTPDDADEPDGTQDPAPTPSPTATGPAPDEVAVTAELMLAGTEVTAEVYPVVRVGDLAVLTMDLAMDPDSDKDSILLSGPFTGTAPILLPTLSAVRLVDLEGDQVHTVAVDADGDAVTTGDSFIPLRPDGLRLQTAYAAPPPDVETIGLFLPGGPYLAEVPVVDGEVPDPDLPGTPDDPEASTTVPLELDTVAEAPVVGLESFTRELAGAVQTLTTTEEVEVTLGSDVLFAVDSADLTPESQAAVDAAAAHLEGREPGTILVVGHTDDVADDAYNQDLSERRAEAVAAALAERVDAGAYPVRTEGRGEAEPLVPNVDDESRAMNRRVTLTLSSTRTESVEVATTGELPEFDGPVGTAADGVVVEYGQRYRLTAEARRVEGHLVVDLAVGPLDEPGGFSFLSGVFHHRGEMWSTQTSAGGVTVLVGATAVYPLDHLHAISKNGGYEQWLPLTDLETRGDVPVGGTRTFSIVYPDIGEVDEVAVQVRAGLGSTPFRLTDIPVR